MKQRVTRKDSFENQSSMSLLLQEGMIISGKFKLMKKLGQGSFGVIYQIQNINTNEFAAAKFEKRYDKRTISNVCLLVREIKILLKLNGLFGFPKLQFYGREEAFNYFIMDYLGESFEQLLSKCGGKFSLQASLKLSLQLLTRLEDLHKKMFIHRDLKPENFLLGNDGVTLYLIDFGLSKSYIDSKGVHIPFSKKKGIIGTSRYCSINALQGNEQSRKDDLESLGYCLVYLLKGNLPWANLKVRKQENKQAKILEIKSNYPIEKLCENLPFCFLQLILYAKKLQFMESPNYEYLKDIFMKTLLNCQNQSLYDWEYLNEYKNRKESQSYQQVCRQKSKVINKLNLNNLEFNQYPLVNLVNKIQPEVIETIENSLQILIRKDTRSQTVQQGQEISDMNEKDMIQIEKAKKEEYNYLEFDNLDQIAQDITDVKINNFQTKFKFNH